MGQEIEMDVFEIYMGVFEMEEFLSDTAVLVFELVFSTYKPSNDNLK